MNSDFFKMPEKIFGISSSLIKLFLLPLGVVLAFLISLRLVVIPKIDSINSLIISINKIKTEIKISNEKRAYLASVNQEELLRNKSYLSNAVLQAKNSYLLVGVIRGIADKFGYQVKSFSSSPVDVKEGENTLKVADKDVAVKLPVDVSLEGPKDKMIDLLISIENSLPIMFIDKIKMSNKSNTSGIDLTVSSYYISDNSNLISGNLSLNDLMPTAEESGLLSKISQFSQDESLVQGLSEQGADGKSYVEYVRNNPFSP